MYLAARHNSLANSLDRMYQEYCTDGRMSYVFVFEHGGEKLKLSMEREPGETLDSLGERMSAALMLMAG